MGKEVKSSIIPCLTFKDIFIYDWLWEKGHIRAKNDFSELNALLTGQAR